MADMKTTWFCIHCRSTFRTGSVTAPVCCGHYVRPKRTRHWSLIGVIAG